MMIQDFIVGIATVAGAAQSGAPFLLFRNEEFSTEVRMVEKTDEIQFEVTGPKQVDASVSIDRNGNGKIDRNKDFTVGFDQKGPACIYYLLNQGASTDCNPLAGKAKLTRMANGDKSISLFTFPKSAIAEDGAGFGFAVKLFDKDENVGASAGGGRYQFGGQLELTGDQPTFLGDAPSSIPADLQAALRIYEGCLWKSVTVLQPLDKSKAAKLRAVPTTCGDAKREALAVGVASLMASGASKDEASASMQQALGDMEHGIEAFAKRLETETLPH